MKTTVRKWLALLMTIILCISVMSFAQADWPPAQCTSITQLGYDYSVELSESVSYCYFSFTPEETAYYVFISKDANNADPYVKAYDEDGQMLGEDDDGNSYPDFRLAKQLEKDKTYYFYAENINGNQTCSYNVCMTKSEGLASVEPYEDTTSWTIAAGSTQEMKVIIGCQTDYTIKWEKSVYSQENRFYDDWTVIPSQTTDTCVSDPVNTASQYRCTVTDTAGTSLSVTFTVYRENGFSAGVTGGYYHYVDEGSSETIVIDASCDEGELTYLWYDNNYNLIDDADGPEYTISNITQAETGEYRCRVLDEYGNIRWLWFEIYLSGGSEECDHNWSVDGYEWADDHSACTGTAYCTICHGSTTQTVSSEIKVTLQEATCEAAGEATYSATFTEGPFAGHTEEKDGPIPALGHNWGAASYQWSDDLASVTGSHTCGRCAVEEKETVDAAIEEKAATCTEAAQKIRTATFTNPSFETQTSTETIGEALGHDWGDATYTWASDNSSVTAKRTCKRDASHTDTETVKTTSQSTASDTCTKKGTIVYTATFKNAAFTTQTKTVDTDIGPHAWGEATYTWAADNSTVTATRTCTRDASHAETETVKTTVKSTTGTCTTPGTSVYTATFTNSAFTTQTKTVDGVLGDHAWGEVTYVWAEDNSTVTATRVCSIDATHIETETAAATYAVTKEPAVGAEGVGTYTSAAFANPAFTVQTKDVPIPALTEIKDESGSYDIVPDQQAVTYTAVPQKTAKEATVPDTITVNGQTYKVTGIAANAFKGMKNLTKVKIGKNVQTIGANAFAGDKKLKAVTGGANVTTIGDGAFQNCTALKEFTIGKKVTKIGKNAFKGCKKLKLITVKTAKLTMKNVGKDAFKGIPKGAVIKCPKKQKTLYKKIFKKKGAKGAVYK